LLARYPIAVRGRGYLALRLNTELSVELVEGGSKVPAKVLRVSSDGVLGIAFSDDEMVRSQIRPALETDSWRGALAAA
jgi:hypothetical protein